MATEQNAAASVNVEQDVNAGEQRADTSINVEQDISPGELVDDRSIVVAVTSRRKLGKQLTIARCVVDDVRGELSGGLARDEIIDVVAGGASAKAFAAGPAQRPRHRLGAVVIEAKPSRSGRRVARVLRYDGAVLRVVAVHRPPSEALCTLDLTRGFDELMLSEVPTVDRRSDEAARNGPPLRGGSRISAGALSPPHHMLVVPCFFGGVLHLRNDIDVRVIDARWRAADVSVSQYGIPEPTTEGAKRLAGAIHAAR